jgi:hypothetical protein
LAETTSFMGEDLHVVTRAAGVAGGVGGRYVGFSRSRVRDGSGELCSIKEFCSWTDGLASQLAPAVSGYDYFDRFSSSIAAPSNPDPVNVLLDLNAIQGAFARSDGTDMKAIEDLCADVTPAGSSGSGHPWHFRVKLDGQPAQLINVGIAYDQQRAIYELESPELAQFTERGNPRRNLIGALNKDQAFRIITATSGVAYVAGAFYDIASAGRLTRMRAAVLSLLYPVTSLRTIRSEKGIPPSPGPNLRWSAGSLFNFIDEEVRHSTSRRRMFTDRFEHLVCDDLNDEVADFIGVQSGPSPKVVFIHAKAKTGDPGAGASNLYDVCAQAAKNLVYIRFGARPLPSNARKWNGSWQITNNSWQIKAYKVNDRIRCGGLTSAGVRSEIEKALENPRTTREVWIALGSILSKAELESGLSARAPRAYSIQAAYLLMSLDSACKSVGVQLKVFCSP